jgi:urease accessory protein
LPAVFALFHGYAHGLEMPEAASPGAYAAGFVLATASLHLVGIGFGFSARGQQALIRVSGAAIAVAGAWLLAAG